MRSLLEGNSTVLKLIIECFPYILKAQLWKLFGKKKSRGYEIIRELVNEGVLGVGIFRGVEYVYPLSKLVAWNSRDPKVIPYKKTPSDTLLLDCFIRAEQYIRGKAAIPRESKILKKFIPQENQSIQEFRKIEEKIKKHEAKKTQWNHNYLEQIKSLAQQPLFPADMLKKAASRIPLIKITRKDLEDIQNEVHKLHSEIIDLAQKLQNSAYQFGQDTCKWEINHINLEEEREELLKEQVQPLPFQLDKYQVQELQYFKVNRTKRSSVLSNMLANTEMDRLLIVDNVIQQLKTRNCYIVDTAGVIGAKQTLLVFYIVGFGESSKERYLHALRLFEQITLCFPNSSFGVAVACPDEGEMKAISRKFNAAVEDYNKHSRLKLEERWTRIANLDLDRYWKGGNDPKTHYKVDKDEIRQKVVAGLK